MKAKVNLYVAWDKGVINPKISFSQTADYEGVAESIEEFVQMCQRNGFDVDSANHIQCLRKDVRKLSGFPCDKWVFKC